MEIDYAKKHWKTKISQYLTDSINKKISNSDLPKEYIKIIHKPNSLLFTANVKESDNCGFLEKDLKTILTFGKEKNENKKKMTVIYLKYMNILEKLDMIIFQIKC